MIAEITQVSETGIWLVLDDEEYHLCFDDFPWFRGVHRSAIQNVQLLNGDHLFWPDLDIDLSVESIEHPERFPLVAT